MSKTIQLNDCLPEITVQTTEQEKLNLNTLTGKNVIIYFYPKNNTPGCTLEAKAFRDLYHEFKQKNTIIFGVSRDKFTSHKNFIKKHKLPFALINDQDEKLCNLFGVIKENSVFGKKICSIQRSTFLFNASGQLVQEWRKVKIFGHAKQVLAAINN